MTAKPIHISITVTRGNFTAQAVLNGFAYVSSGFLSGDIVGLDGHWSESDSVLASLYTFTGCPIAARTPSPSLNPWLKTNGSYSSVREIDLDGAKVRGELDSVGDDTGISMNLRITADSDVPGLSAITAPFQEQIQGTGPGALTGLFDAPVLTANGKRVSALAKTQYRLSLVEVPGTVWRNITIVGFAGSDRYSQIEQIDLYGEQKIANSDLSAKKNAFNAQRSPKLAQTEAANR